MFCRNLLIYLSLISVCLVGQINSFAFIQNKKIKFDESFILQTGETAETENTKLKINLKSVGRTISQSGEVEYVELKIRLNNSEQFLQISEKGNRKKVIGNYVIKLINAESFGKTNCELKVSRKN